MRKNDGPNEPTKPLSVQFNSAVHLSGAWKRTQSRIPWRRLTALFVCVFAFVCVYVGRWFRTLCHLCSGRKRFVPHAGYPFHTTTQGSVLFSLCMRLCRWLWLAPAIQPFALTFVSILISFHFTIPFFASSCFCFHLMAFSFLGVFLVKLNGVCVCVCVLSMQFFCYDLCRSLNFSSNYVAGPGMRRSAICKCLAYIVYICRERARVKRNDRIGINKFLYLYIVYLCACWWRHVPSCIRSCLQHKWQRVAACGSYEYTFNALNY